MIDYVDRRGPSMVLASSHLTAWYVGYGLALVVVVLVVALLLAIIMTARRITAVAEDITSTLHVARDRTEALWRVGTTNQVAGEILETATVARKTLEGS
jgi:hypothetical protein